MDEPNESPLEALLEMQAQYTNEIGYRSKTRDFLTEGGFTAIFESKELKRQKSFISLIPEHETYNFKC